MMVFEWLKEFIPSFVCILYVLSEIQTPNCFSIADATPANANASPTVHSNVFTVLYYFEKLLCSL